MHGLNDGVLACWREQEIDPNPESQRLGTGDEEGSFLADLAGSIPGIDEAMSFAEVMRQVQLPAVYMHFRLRTNLYAYFAWKLRPTGLRHAQQSMVAV